MIKKNPTLLLGAHMSIAGGFEQAIFRGESIGCTVIQIFSKSNRQWNTNPITPEQALLFKETVEKSTIQAVVTHASYLINLASPDADTTNKSTKALIEELNRCEQLGIPYLVLHPGSHGKTTEQEGLKRVAEGIDKALSEAAGTTMILLENMAGQGSSVCRSFENIALLRSLIQHKKRVGVCFDTCHAFAAGYDFRTEATYQKMWKNFDDTIGLENLKVMHINDSKKEVGSCVDRHEEIGEGAIGLEAFRLIFNDPRFFGIPKILETPKDDLQDYARNMRVIHTLLSQETDKILGLVEDKTRVK